MALRSIFLLILLTSQTTSLHAEEVKIIMLGDSLSAGYGVAEEDAYPALVQDMLRKQNLPATLINSSISGSTTAGAVSRLKWQLRAKPTHLFLALGANDGLRGIKLDSTAANLRKAIDFAKENGLQVLMAGIKVPPNYGPEYFKKFENLFVKVAAEHKIPLLPFLLEGVAGERALNQADGIHPNEEGHKVIAQTVFEFFKKEIFKK